MALYTIYYSYNDLDRRLSLIELILYYIYSNCILHPYGSSNYNTKACKHIKEKQYKHNTCKYVNVGEIFEHFCVTKIKYIMYNVPKISDSNRVTE